MSTVADWAVAWRIPPAALADLAQRLAPPDPPSVPGRSEAAVQAAARAEASRLGWRVWRNNLGAYTDPDSGAFVRYGLANDTAAVNKRIKSADLIGLRPVLVTPHHVGAVIGQFVSLEVKHAGWKYSGTEREVAQAAWAALVGSLGGYARFVAGGSLC